MTPDKYGRLSTRAAQVTDEKWTNRDGSTSRGWLLRGAENAPAVILLHKYGADRSYVLNLGVKMNESTNFTVLMPDQRGHGENPTVQNASFGGCEAEDITAAVEFLRYLKTPNQMALVGKNLGIFGVEMGAMVAVTAAANDPDIKAIAIDSVPINSDDVVKETVERRYPFVSFATSKLARLGTYMYFYDGCYKRDAVCDTAKKIENRDVLLLAASREDPQKVFQRTLDVDFLLAMAVGTRNRLNLRAFLDLADGVVQHFFKLSQAAKSRSHFEQARLFFVVKVKSCGDEKRQGFSVGALDFGKAATIAAHLESGDCHTLKQCKNLVGHGRDLARRFFFIFEKLNIGDQIRLARIDVIEKPVTDNSQWKYI